MAYREGWRPNRRQARSDIEPAKLVESYGTGLRFGATACGFFPSPNRKNEDHENQNLGNLGCDQRKKGICRIVPHFLSLI